jgi:hypothetical protein
LGFDFDFRRGALRCCVQSEMGNKVYSWIFPNWK